LKIRLQQTGFKESRYERPNQKWVCGWTCQGKPCSVGPDGRGRCTAGEQANCKPQQKGDRWICTRLTVFGGPCENGPTPQGKCCHPQPEQLICQPRLSLRARRVRVVFMSLALAIGLLAFLLIGPWRMSFISPGKLSNAHAELKGPDGAVTNCASCHIAADNISDSGGSLINATLLPSNALGESEKCAKCHFQTEHGTDPHAHFVHSMNPEDLKQRTEDIEQNPAGARRSLAVWISNPPVTSNNQMACASCHREHQGRHHNLTQMTNRQCQVCHKAKFKSFGGDHAEFKNQRPRQGIAFDHLLHRPKMLGAGTGFDCAMCHGTDHREQIGKQMPLNKRVLKYACASCHKTDLKQAPATISLVKLPLMEPDVPWWDNAMASQDEEEAISPILWLMLAGDNQALAPLSAMWSSARFEASPTLDLLENPDLDEEKGAQLQTQLAKAFKKLILELSHDDAKPLQDRLAQALGLKPDHRAVVALVKQLQAGQFTINEYADELGLEPKLLDGAPPARTPYDYPVDGDDVPFVVYRTAPEQAEDGPKVDPTIVHGNAFIKAWLDALAANASLPPDKSAPSKDQKKPTPEQDEQEPKPKVSPVGFRTELRAALFRTEIDNYASACIKCHKVESSLEASLINWSPPPRTANYLPFSHGSHLGRIPKAQSCTHCHRWEGDLNKVKDTVHGFLGHSKQDCATCHTPKRQNDSCISCHNYHVNRP
jgi:predicted CXXCH cytochrome family protein